MGFIVVHNQVFIGSDRRPDPSADREELPGLVKQVLPILTGLGAEQLRAFESYRVIDLIAETVLIPPTPFQPGGSTPVAGGAV